MSNLMALHGNEKNGFSLTGGSARIMLEVSEIICDYYLALDDEAAFCLWKQRYPPSEQA